MARKQTKRWDKVAAQEFEEMQGAYAQDAEHPDDWSDLREKTA